MLQAKSPLFLACWTTQIIGEVRRPLQVTLLRGKYLASGASLFSNRMIETWNIVEPHLYIIVIVPQASTWVLELVGSAIRSL